MQDTQWLIYHVRHLHHWASGKTRFRNRVSRWNFSISEPLPVMHEWWGRNVAGWREGRGQTVCDLFQIGLHVSQRFSEVFLRIQAWHPHRGEDGHAGARTHKHTHAQTNAKRERGVWSAEEHWLEVTGEGGLRAAAQTHVNLHPGSICLTLASSIHRFLRVRATVFNRRPQKPLPYPLLHHAAPHPSPPLRT